jgi:hypothetical protein
MKKIDFVCILKVTKDFGADPDPYRYQNVTDPEHC